MIEFDPTQLRHVPSPAEVEAGRTERGGFTREQLATWGVPWPPPKRWRARLKSEYMDRIQIAAYDPHQAKE